MGTGGAGSAAWLRAWDASCGWGKGCRCRESNRGRWLQPSFPDRRSQFPRLRFWADAQLPLQEGLQPGVLGERKRGVAHLGMEAHEVGMGRFIQGISDQRPLARRNRLRELPPLLVKSCQPGQDGEKAGAQTLSPRLSPVLVGIFGEQCPAVEGGSLLGNQGVAALPGSAHGFRKGIHIDVHVIRWSQEQPITVTLEEGLRGGASGLETPSGVMQGPAQIVGRVFYIEIRPEDVEQVLAMQPMPRLQRQQFDYGCRSPLPPESCGNLLITDADVESAKQLHLEVGGSCHTLLRLRSGKSSSLALRSP